MPGKDLPAEGYRNYALRVSLRLEGYIQEFRKATELLMLANYRDSDLQRFLAQRARETHAYETYQEARRRYDDFVRNQDKHPKS